MRGRFLVSLVLLMVLAPASVRASADDMRFPATRIDGAAGALRGPAVVILWASWCVPCRAELKRMPSFRKAAAPLKIATLALEPPGSARRFAERARLDLGEAYADPRPPAEVLAAELQQSSTKDSGRRSLVPRVVGQTAEAEKRKGVSRQQRLWDDSSFFPELERRCGDQDARVARRLYDWADEKNCEFYWGKGAKDGSVRPIFRNGLAHLSPFLLSTSGIIQVRFDYMNEFEPFSDANMRTELLRRINEIDGVDIPVDRIDSWPSIRMSTLANETSQNQFLTSMDWAVEQFRQAKHHETAP